jgi:septum formation protein
MAKQSPIRLILASGSAGRRYLLSREGYSFEVLPSNVEEPDGTGVTDPRCFVEHLAWLKAAAVVARVLSSPGEQRTWILAADTVGWLNGQIIGKPADEADARRILRLLGGTEHELWTGVCLWRHADGIQVAWQEVSRVAFRGLTDAELDSYLATCTWQGCSGAYAIKEAGDPFVQVVEGSITNVIGLPMESLARIMGRLREL